MFEGKHYIIASESMPHKPDKTIDDDHFILTLFAIAKELTHDNMDFLADLNKNGATETELVVGLPPKDYQRQREGFAKYFQREKVEFKFNFLDICIEITKVFVFPQAYAAAIALKEKFEGSNLTNVVDIGGHTADCLRVLKDFKLDGDTVDSRKRQINPRLVVAVGLFDAYDYSMGDAVKATAEMLSIFVNLMPSEGNESDLLGILRGAVRSYYNTVGVKEGNVDTWHLSQEMNFKTLLSFVASQKDSSDENPLYTLITNRLAEQFMTYGINDNSRNLQLQDLLSYSVISFNFNKNTEVKVTLIDQVRIYMVMMVTKRLAKLNKQNDLFTLLFAEEAQRYGDLPVLCQGLSDLASGSRSDNLSIVAIMNDLNIMRKEEMSAFRANVANFVIGKIDAEGIRVLRDVFKKEILAEKVSAIVENPKRFNRIFAVHFSIGDVELNLYNRCDVPKSVAELFKTRSVMIE